MELTPLKVRKAWRYTSTSPFAFLVCRGKLHLSLTCRTVTNDRDDNTTLNSSSAKYVIHNGSFCVFIMTLLLYIHILQLIVTQISAFCGENYLYSALYCISGTWGFVFYFLILCHDNRCYCISLTHFLFAMLQLFSTTHAYPTHI